MFDRRQFLGGLGALLLAPGARALGPQALVHIAELDLGPGSTSRPSAWRRMLAEVVHTTSVECDVTKVPRVKADDPELFEHPFLVLVAEGAFALPEGAALDQLARYLDYGGTLFIDDVSGASNSGAEASARQLARAVFPTRPLAPLAPDHAVFRAFFLIDKPVGRTARHGTLEGVSYGTTTPLMLFRDDLSGALERDQLGRERPMSEGQRREAVKLAVNLMLYALTSTYKHDQAHVAELLRQRRLDGFWE
jgi:hypothetical protein